MYVKKKIVPFIKLFIIISIIIITLDTFFIRVMQVVDTSMFPLFQVNDIYVVKKISFKTHNFKRGEIVLLKQKDTFVIRRILGVEGDKIEYREGKLYINDILTEEPFLIDNTYKMPNFSVVVPRYNLFVLCDNRYDTNDSRSFGCIDRSNVVGQVIMVLFPIKHIKTFFA